MTFKLKNTDLAGRQLRNMDEQIAVRAARRNHLLQAEALRARDLELTAENQEIAHQLRPASQSNVAFVDFRNDLRPTYGYLEAYADAA